MKILLLYTYNKGFLATFFTDLAIEITKQGHEVKVFSLKKENRKFVQEEVEVIIKKKGNKLSNTREIYKCIKDFRPEIVVSNFSYVNPALVSGKLLGIKKNIAWFHTLSEQLKPSKKEIAIKSFFLKKASALIVNSPYLKQDLRKNYGLNNKIYELAFWSTIADQNDRIFPVSDLSDKEEIILGCPGRIEKVKNQEMLIELLSSFRDKERWKLYFAGSGSEENKLKKKAETLELKDKIYFSGNLSPKEMQEFYNKVDVVLLPSAFEAFGLVFIEALKLNKPVLCSSAFGALTYIYDEEFQEKFTFEPSDKEELVQKLMNLIRITPNLPATYFREKYEYYFSKEEIVKRFLELVKAE